MSPLAVVDLGLADPEADRLLSDAEGTGDPGDRAVALALAGRDLADHPNGALFQFRRIPPPRGEWDADRLIARIEEKGEPGAADAARSLLRWAADRRRQVRPRGRVGTATLFVPLPGEPRVITIWVPGSLQWPFGGYKAPFDSVELRRDLLAKIAALSGKRWTTGSPPAARGRFRAQRRLD